MDWPDNFRHMVATRYFAQKIFTLNQLREFSVSLGRASRCSVACVCQQAGSSQCNERGRDHRQAWPPFPPPAPLVSSHAGYDFDGAALTKSVAMTLSQVHPEHVCHLRGGALRRAGLALQQHRQQSNELVQFD